MTKPNYTKRGATAIEKWSKDCWELVEAVEKIVDIECSGRCIDFPLTSISMQKVRSYYTIAKQFGNSHLKNSLSFEYFELLAGHPRDAEILQKCINEDWTVDDLRLHLLREKMSVAPATVIKRDYEELHKLAFESAGKSNFVPIVANRSGAVFSRFGSRLLTRDNVHKVYVAMGKFEKQMAQTH